MGFYLSTVIAHVYRVDRELRAGGVAYGAALAQRVGIGQEVSRLGLGNVTSAASRRDGLVPD